MSTHKHPVIVLISGQGTNLQALIDATTTTNTLPNAQVVRVISNKKDAFGLTRAREANIPSTHHDLDPYKQQQPDTKEGRKDARLAYDRDLASQIISNDPKPSLVVCAGWMLILSSEFIDALADADIDIINLHPALPGQFEGINAIQRAWGAFQRGEIVSTGVMVHYVISKVDAGEPIAVREVECEVGEDENGLETRIHKVEWEIIVEGTAEALRRIEER